VIFIFPTYFVFTLKEGFIITWHKIELKEYKEAFRVGSIFLLDALLPFSVICLGFYILKGWFLGLDHDIYVVWCKMCFIFFMSYILLH
jgi:hypothetical protein